MSSGGEKAGVKRAGVKRAGVKRAGVKKAKKWLSFEKVALFFNVFSSNIFSLNTKKNILVHLSTLGVSRPSWNKVSVRWWSRRKLKRYNFEQRQWKNYVIVINIFIYCYLFLCITNKLCFNMNSRISKKIFFSLGGVICGPKWRKHKIWGWQS